MEDGVLAFHASNMTYTVVNEDEDESLKVTLSLLDVKSVPSRTLAFYSVDELPLVKYEIQNKTAKTRRVILRSEIKDLSDPRQKEPARLLPHSHTIHYQLPFPIFEQAEMQGPDRERMVSISISYQKDGDKPAFLATTSIYVLAYDKIRLATANPKGGWISCLKHLVSWITPRDKEVQKWVGKAAYGRPLPGYQNNNHFSSPKKQIEAIYEVLRSNGQLILSQLIAMS